MQNASPFGRLEEDGPVLALDVEGERVEARAGESVAAALLAAGRLAFRETPVGAAPRGPFCMMGACFDCLVEIDGEPNRQACMTEVADGMRVRAMRGARPVGPGDDDDA